jgi:putative DNA primase/helicase
MPSFDHSRGAPAEPGEDQETQEAPAVAETSGGDAAQRLDTESDVIAQTDPGQAIVSFASGTLDGEQEERRFALLDAAVSYGRRGWKVIPLRWVDENNACSCKLGAECPSGGKHPLHMNWPEVATSDIDEIAKWWRQDPGGPLPEDWYPQANIGIVTGQGSGIFVLDVDEGGELTLAQHEARFKTEMPLTRIVTTGSGGTHYYFRHPDFEIRNSAKKMLGAGLDVRGYHGFVVAPLSISSRGPYEIAPVHDIDPVDAPAWMLEKLRSYDSGQRGVLLAGREPVASTGYARRYAEKAVEAESARLRDAAPGTRNDQLNQSAFSLGTLGGAGLLEEEVARTALHEAARACGLNEHEILPTFLSGWRKGLQAPRDIQWKVLGDEWPIRARTDFGLADRMADHYADVLRWSPELKVWMVYAGGSWIAGTSETGEWYAQQMLRNLLETEGAMYDPEPGHNENGDQQPSPLEDFEDWCHKQQTVKAVSAATRLSKGLAIMRISQATLNPDPLLLNAINGTIDLRDGTKLDHDPEHRISLQCPVSYVPMATAPRWEAFLERFQPDPEMRAYLQRIAGYSATGLTDEQVLFVHHGSTGANGKSVFQDVLEGVLGGYAQSVPVETLMQTNVEGRVPNDVARMVGRRLLAAAETRAGKALDEQLVKQLTGGDTISARFMRSEFFDFKVIGKIHLATNHLPRLTDDEATWRRVRLIPWNIQIPQEERIGGYAQILLRDEGEGILWWIVQGAMEWLRQGLNPPAVALEAVADYRYEEDSVAQFVEQALIVLSEDQWVSAEAVGSSCSEIWRFYILWAEENGHPKMRQPMLTSRLKKKGHEHLRSNGWTGFRDLRVRAV